MFSGIRFAFSSNNKRNETKHIQIDQLLNDVITCIINLFITQLKIITECTFKRNSNYFFFLKYYSTNQDIIPPLFCTCPKTGPGVQIPHAMGFFCVWFVDIGGIVHHHCLNFLSIFTNIHLRTFCICYQQTLINNYAPDCVLFVYFHFIISFCGECPASKDQMIDLCSILPLYPCKEQFLFFFFCFAKKIDIGFY